MNGCGVECAKAINAFCAAGISPRITGWKQRPGWWGSCLPGTLWMGCVLTAEGDVKGL